MEAKDPEIIVSLEDSVKRANQENFLRGTSASHSMSIGQQHSSGRGDGSYQRKPHYNNYNYQRNGRQGNNQHGYNNGYNNHPYNNGYNNGNNHHHHQQHNSYGGGGRNYGNNKRNYYQNDHYASQQNNYQHAPHNNHHQFRQHNQYNNYHHRNNHYHQQNPNHYNNRHSQPQYSHRDREGINQLESATGAVLVNSDDISPSSSVTHLSLSRPSSAVSTGSDKLTDTMSSASTSSVEDAQGISLTTTLTSDEDGNKSGTASPSPVSTVTLVLGSLPLDDVAATPLLNAELKEEPKAKNGMSSRSFLSLPREPNSASNGGTSSDSPREQRFQNNTFDQPHYYTYPPNGHSHPQFNTHRDGPQTAAFDPPRFFNTHHHNHHRRPAEPPFELISPLNGLPYFFPGSALDPLLPGRPFFNPGFMYPELQFGEPGKHIMGDTRRGPGLIPTPTWSCYESDVVEENCLPLLPFPDPGSPGGPGSHISDASSGAYKKRMSNGPFANRISPSPQHALYRRGWDSGRQFHFDSRGNWSQTAGLDELWERFHYVDESEKPEDLAPPGHEYEQLSEQVWTKFQNNQQTLETFTRKWELWRDLSECVRKYNPAFHLELVGSTISGFGSNSSDVDMCLIVNHRNDVSPRAEAIDLLEGLCPLFETIPNLKRKDLILAKVPILKLRENVHGIDLDINVNNSVGVRNSLLLYSYAICDWRVRPLVLVAKLWAQAQGINDAKLMTLSSYSLALMVIHYLQHGVSPPILPCLQFTYPDRFEQLAELWRTKKTLSDKVPAVEHMDNGECLGELLVGFLEYFAVKFDYRTSAVSVRIGSTMTIRSCSNNRAPKNDAYQWKHICIEEPFELTNTARSVYDKDSFDRIRGVFFSSWQRLAISRNLDTIFQSISPAEARSIGARARQYSN